jgi:coronin-1B/1C/6
LIRGHTGPVLDVKFSPFRNNLLATASDDATVRLWEIPEGGLKEDIKVENQKFTGHSKKVGLLNFHPTVAELVASSGADNNVFIWNIINSQSLTKLSLADTIMSIDWNHNGSLLGLTTKEKLVHVADPRNGKIELSAKAHDSSKSQKMAFLNQDYLFSCGFNRSNERQLKLYDLRNFSEAVQQIPVDSQTGIMIPFYDADTGLIFVPGRGEGNVKYYDFSNNTIKFASEFRSSVPQKGMALFPKRACNYNRCEVDRFAKMTINSIEYLSFYVPKRNEGYDSAVYPDCLSGEPALTYDEWVGGKNAEAVRKSITSLSESGQVSGGFSFTKSEETTSGTGHRGSIVNKHSDDNSGLVSLKNF